MSHRFLASSFLLFAVAVLVGSTGLEAQVTTATLYGVVNDSTGAVIPGASITATHQGTGVSRDSVKSHDNFFAKQSLSFPLLSDADETLCNAFGVIKEKTLYGRKHLGIERSTFLFDAKGKLRREWRGVKVAGHAAEVLQAAKEL